MEADLMERSVRSVFCSLGGNATAARRKIVKIGQIDVDTLLRYDDKDVLIGKRRNMHEPCIRV
jgi:hypothetical protein